MKRYFIAITLILATVSAHAELFSFYGITSNDPSGEAVTIGEAQLTMDVNNLGTGFVSFLFENTGPDASVISEIYFDSPDVIPPLNLEFFDIINGPGVSFSEDAVPPDLPNGNSPLIQFCADESAEAGNPATKKGVNPGDYVEIQMTFTDPPHNILDMLNSGELRVGLHVISMGYNGLGETYSESFINNIPEPSTALLLGFVALVGRSYRKIFVV